MKILYLFTCWITCYFMVAVSKNILTENQQQQHENMKLLTIITTFVDFKNTSDDSYRQFVQYNFLKSTQFNIFLENVNFLVYTNSKRLTEYISKYYPNIILRREPKSEVFSVSMLKRLFQDSISTINSHFYMYTNGDILYDRNLIHTVTYIKQLLDVRLLRNKVLIVGRRHNKVLTEYVRREQDVDELANTGQLFIKDAQDYFIVTRNSISWSTFPEYLVGRRGYDNAMVDFAFRNEFELIDATNTITALHQSNVKGEFLWKYHNNQEHDWNAMFWAPKIRHFSTDDARYYTQTTNNKIALFDKVTDTPISLESYPENWVNFNTQLMLDPSRNTHKLADTKLSIVVLAYNRPESLKRLLASLRNVDYGMQRIDLRVNLDIDLDNMYDLECLKVLYSYNWNQGTYLIHRHTEHQGTLNQWLGAWEPKASSQERTLILEDSMIVSEQFFAALEREWNANNDDISGISLEPSFVTYHKNRHTPDYIFRYSNRLVSQFKISRAFIPNQRYWREFLDWKRDANFSVELLKHAPAYQHRFHGYYTNWYQYEFSVWFSYFSEFVHPLSTVYLGNRNGYLTTRHYFDSEWPKFYSEQWYREYLLLDTAR